jgi:hypothetical protein
MDSAVRTLEPELVTARVVHAPVSLNGDGHPCSSSVTLRIRVLFEQRVIQYSPVPVAAPAGST